MKHSKRKLGNIFIEISGWLGLVAILLAFSLASAGAIEARSYAFQLLTLYGSLSLGVISLLRKAYQPAVLNIVLGVIALVTIVTLTV